MLEEISIKNLGIIDSAKLEFGQGLTAITGETGAGKTMVLSALHLLLGKRASANRIQHGKDSLSVEGCWSLEDKDFIGRVEETGAEVDDGQLFINRTVKKDGKSRAVAGGKSIPASVLSSLGDELVNIHGQSDQIRLKTATAQLEALDRYAGENLHTQLEKYGRSYRALKTAKKQLDEVSNNSAQKKREITFLKSFIKEYDQLAPQPNELELLQDEISQLSNVDTVREFLSHAYSAFQGTDELGFYDAIDHVASNLAKLVKFGSNYEKLQQKYEKAIELINQVEHSINLELDSLDMDAIERLAEATERQQELKRFSQKNSATLESLAEEREQAEKSLEQLSVFDTPLEDLEAQVSESHRNLMVESSKLTKLRRAAAEKLSSAVNSELSGLAMGSAKFSIEIEKVDPGSKGTDKISFTLQQKGQAAAGIADGASGGELSRIMLALEVSLSSGETGKTFVFDEVDSGVGGAVALEIGRRLGQLAKTAQVIVVTHLPQVAAYATNHLKVVKTEQEHSVSVTVDNLNENARVDEICRMLSGVTDSESGREHAHELLNRASKELSNDEI